MEQILIFLAGFILEIIATIDVIAVQRREAFKSALATFIMVFLGYTVFYNIILSPDVIWNIVVNAMGAGLGGFVTIKWNKCKV